jgi:hypothetical protein
VAIVTRGRHESEQACEGGAQELGVPRFCLGVMEMDVVGHQVHEKWLNRSHLHSPIPSLSKHNIQKGYCS